MNSLPNYFIHLILSYTHPFALLQISICDKRFQQISKNEKYYDYVICEDCTFKEALNKGPRVKILLSAIF